MAQGTTNRIWLQRGSPHTRPLQTRYRPVWFTLVVDDFGIKYIGQENAQHLIDALKYFYEVEIYWKRKFYCGIILDWHYDAKYGNISMPNYVRKQLTQYKPDPPRRPQYSPYEPKPIHYGKRSDDMLVELDSSLLGQADKNTSNKLSAVSYTMQERLISQSYFPSAPLQQNNLTQQNAQCNKFSITCNICTPIQTQSSNSEHPIWYSTSTQMHHTSPHPKAELEPLDIYSLVASHAMEKTSRSMET